MARRYQLTVDSQNITNQSVASTALSHFITKEKKKKKEKDIKSKKRSTYPAFE